ncbi:MAG: prolyl oligopeptidase family serine peptidase [Pseudomonadota bacterium]
MRPGSIVHCPLSIISALVLGYTLLLPTASQALDYQSPSPDLVQLVDAPPTPWVSASPDHRWLLLMARPARTPIDELAAPEARLAGSRINPRTTGPSRLPYAIGLTFQEIATGAERPVTGLPEGARLRRIRWAPDVRHVAFTVTVDERIELWVAATGDGAARRLTERPLSDAFGTTMEWTPDGLSLLCKLIPDGRGPAPEPPRVPAGPMVEESVGRTAPARTYQDLLQTPHDEALFEHLLAAQLTRVTLEGAVVSLGAPAIYREFDPSPSGEYLLVQRLHRPWSTLVQADRFPRTVEILDAAGAPVKAVAEIPLIEEMSTDFAAAPDSPRGFEWRSDAPATLVWAEARDGGDPRRVAEIRDELLTWSAPFDDPPRSLVKLGLRYGGIYWGRDDLAVVVEWWWETRNVRTWILQPGAPERAPVALYDRNWEDRYTDPGAPVQRFNAQGRAVLLGDDGHLFFIGEGASPEGNRPFLDRLDLETRKTERLFRSEGERYEDPVLLLDDDAGELVIRREAVDTPPNFLVRNLETKAERFLTRFPHPTPQLLGVSKEMIQYQRKDGVTLNGTLYLPPGYDRGKDGPLPTLLWVYPAEFKSADHAGQVTDSPYRFVQIGWWSPLFFLIRGWAVLDDPTLPIVGEGEAQPNDTYVEQLVAGAEAAVAELTRRGVSDPGRMAVGGHSYGAFTTANLLAHTDLFKAGIARSGAYNRTLTPFGFQAEERSFWEAPEVYMTLSPFSQAPKINEPLLLIHGEADENSGTHPLQTRRFYNALQGQGATVRMVLLPHEGHGYQARESILHMLWEMQSWLDRWVPPNP